MKITEIKTNPTNPRQIKDDKFKKLCNSIKDFPKMMKLRPIVVDKDMMILGGNMRYRALQELGYTEIPDEWVKVADELTDEENKRFIVEDNISFGEFNFDELGNQYEIDDLLEWGFDEKELDKYFDVQEDDFNADEEYNKIDEPTVKLGDVYQLGNNKLLCGDSTISDNYKKLLGEVKANMIFTDPPYNVNYNYAKYTDGRKMKWKKIFNDNKSSESYYQFLLDTFKNLFDFTTDEMSIYICHATKTQWENWAAFKDAGFHFSQTIIWLKERFILAMGQDWHRIYEPILFGWKEGLKHYKNKTITKESEFWNLEKIDFEEELDLWYLNRDKVSVYQHPTQKPVRLPERAIKKNLPSDGIVLEPFCGSGSTLLACEQLNHKCYAIELDPKYCDVIIKRWENFTGQKAVKL